MNQVNKALSQFQLGGWRIVEMHFDAHHLPKGTGKPFWTFSASRSIEKNDDTTRSGCVFAKFAMKSDKHSEPAISGVAVCDFVFHSRDEEESAEQQVDMFSKRNALLFTISTLRVFLYNQLHFLGVNNYIFPNININDFKFDQEYQFEI